MWEGIVGAVVGALSVVLFELLRHAIVESRRKRRLVYMLREEVRQLVEYLEARQDIARQVIEALDRQEMLPATSLPPPDIIYRTFMPHVADAISNDDRLRLALLYGSSRSVHTALSETESRWLQLSSLRAHDVATSIVRSGVQECLDYMDVLKEVAAQFISESSEPFHLIRRRM